MNDNAGFDSLLYEAQAVQQESDEVIRFQHQRLVQMNATLRAKQAEIDDLREQLTQARQAGSEADT